MNDHFGLLVSAVPSRAEHGYVKGFCGKPSLVCLLSVYRVGLFQSEDRSPNDLEGYEEKDSHNQWSDQCRCECKQRPVPLQYQAEQRSTFTCNVQLAPGTRVRYTILLAVHGQTTCGFHPFQSCDGVSLRCS